MISVVICSCSMRKTIIDAIQSVLTSSKKTSTKVEIIVVDNSRFNTLEAVVAPFFPIVRYVKESRQGISYARNKGIKEAKGDIIAFVDDDAFVDENWIKTIEETLSNTSYIACGGKVKPIFDRELPSWIKKYDLVGKCNGIFVSHDLGDLKKEYDRSGALAFTTNFAFKKECFIKYGGFNTFLTISEDTDIAERLLSEGEKIFYCPDMVVFHRTSMSRFKKSYFIKWYYVAGLSRAKITSKSKHENNIIRAFKDLTRIIFRPSEYKNIFVKFLRIVCLVGIIFGSISFYFQRKSFKIIEKIRSGLYKLNPSLSPKIQTPAVEYRFLEKDLTDNDVWVVAGYNFIDNKKVWRDALILDSNNSLQESLLMELAQYDKEDKSKTREKIEQSTFLLGDKWNSLDGNKKNDFYIDSAKIYKYDLTKYHMQYGTSVQVSELLMFAKYNKAVNILDYGSGIGSASLVFANLGFNMTLTDVSSELLDYAKWRFNRRNFSASFLQVPQNNIPNNKFDIIFSLDVLEHVFNIDAVLDQIFLALKPKGFFFFTVVEQNDLHPMHINTEKDIFRRINAMQLKTYKWYSLGVSMHAVQKI